MRRIALALLFVLASLGTNAHAADGDTPGTSQQKMIQSATAMLEDVLLAYSVGNGLKTESALDPALIGYQVIVDSIRYSMGQQKQVRFAITEMRTAASEGFVVIQTTWEKRYLHVPEMTPVRRAGNTYFVLKLTGNGWRISAIGGDNLFAQ